MADFVQTMKDWRRMCEEIQSENQRTSSGGWCKGCPVQEVCVIDKVIKDATDKGLAMICERIQSWAAEHPEPIYPTWGEWLESIGIIKYNDRVDNINYLIQPTHKTNTKIPTDIAQKLGIKPKEST